MARHTTKLILLATTLVGGFAGSASAQEATTYSYDTHGRVVSVVRSGGPSSGVNTTYTYDAADNRTNVTVTGSRGGSPGGGGDGATTTPSSFIVIPLLGGAVILIN